MRRRGKNLRKKTDRADEDEANCLWEDGYWTLMSHLMQVAAVPGMLDARPTLCQDLVLKELIDLRSAAKMEKAVRGMKFMIINDIELKTWRSVSYGDNKQGVPRQSKT